MSPFAINLLKSRFLAGSLKNLAFILLALTLLIAALAFGSHISNNNSFRLFSSILIPLLCGAIFWILVHAYQSLSQKYAQLKQFMLGFNTPEATFITTLGGHIEWKSPSFIKSFKTLGTVESIDAMLTKISTDEEDTPQLIAACKNLNIDNPEFEKTVWLQEDGKSHRILVRAHYVAPTQTTVWTWVRLDDIQKILLEDFLICDSSEEFLRTVQFKDLYDAAPAGDVLLDTEGRIIHYNSSFTEKFLKDEQLEKNIRFIDLVAEDDRENVAKRLAITTDVSFAVSPFEFRLKWGIDVVAYASLFPYRSLQTGKMVKGFFIQIFDNTEQKIKQQRLAHSQRTQAMGQLASGIAHDFNNLLTAMIGFCDLTLSRYTPADQSYIDIMQIKQNANRAANLVKQLLAFSRQQALQPKVLNITETLAELSVLLQRLIGSSIQFKIIQERNLGLVKVDEGQFEQVIINLVVNARDAIGREGKIFLRTYNKKLTHSLQVGLETVKPGSYVVVEVEDTGSGIADEDLQHIFDPFFSTKEVGSGTGLGLSTVHGIITQTGGHIAVDSQPGIGTKFTIYLPQYSGQTLIGIEGNKNTAPELQQDLSGLGTILLVEDEDAVRLFSARALKDKGYNVIEAASGEEGYNYLRRLHDNNQPPVDLVITDVVMPAMDGPTLARKTHEMFPNLKIIFMSGYAEDSFRKTLDEGKIQFLPKPFSLKELAEKTKEVLHASSVISVSKTKKAIL